MPDARTHYAPGRMDIDRATHPDAGDLFGDPTAAAQAGGGLTAAARARFRSLSDSRAVSWQLVGISVLGVLAAAAVGYTTAENPWAAPAGIAAPLRVVIILTLVGAGVFAQTSEIQARMGRLLVSCGFFSVLWLLNGSGDPLLFSIGALATGMAPLMFACLMLAHPSGRLRSPTEARFLWIVGGTTFLLWLLAVGMTLQPPLNTPLLECAPHCPANVFSLGSATMVVPAVKVVLTVAWLVSMACVPVLLAHRVRAASAPLRRSITPVGALSTLQVLTLVIYMVLKAAGAPAADPVGASIVVIVAAIPIAILFGLARERMFMGLALAKFVSGLAESPGDDPEPMLATALRDPSLSVAYRRPKIGSYVDYSGVPVGLREDQAITWIERDRLPVAAVMYDPALADQEHFVQAAGSVALMRLEKAQLEADLKASTAELAASRIRLVETAHRERRRLERDLHDGVQQQLVSMRIRLDKAARALHDDPERGERELAVVGRQMDEALQQVRSLARGIYPSLLHERGLGEALKSAGRSSPVPPVIRDLGIGRYDEDVEVAVYFACLEALQNITKHAGPDANPVITLWLNQDRLCFEVRDSGAGFDRNAIERASGLVNMRDRTQAVGGDLTITSRPGHGTTVRGRVPAQLRI